MNAARYRKLIVAVVALIAFVAAHFGLDIPPDQQANLVIVLMGLTSLGVWWFPNDRQGEAVQGELLELESAEPVDLTPALEEFTGEVRALREYLEEQRQ